MQVRYCGNSYDPDGERFEMTIVRSWHSQPGEDEAYVYQWLDGKLLGPPQASDTYTQEQLINMGLVSVWLIVAPDTVLRKDDPIPVTELKFDASIHRIYNAPAGKMEWPKPTLKDWGKALDLDGNPCVETQEPQLKLVDTAELREQYGKNFQPDLMTPGVIGTFRFPEEQSKRRRWNGERYIWE